MTLSILRIGVTACVLAATGVTHAATPMMLPFGDLTAQPSTEVALPLPPPPPVVKPDVSQIRLIIKRQAARNRCASPLKPTPQLS